MRPNKKRGRIYLRSGNSNFVPFLEQALGASLCNFDKDGGEVLGAVKDYFVSPAFKKNAPIADLGNP
ncbi:alginate O-acetyltransferase AlgX-related protein [Pseudomonas sp. TTU2014-080ASC]|uniref:alginate O-acetyltransferase AlgX-related protein n=1 Tax=Pseudomonas sp. TTU2014-080ASC TaxID=1729724 RepID=UPI00071860F5|nr:hypothetical protein AO726_14925 [Pseudomonas sp. TTU2014-080ASC]